MNELLRRLPSVDALLAERQLSDLLAVYQREFVRRRCRAAIEEVRRSLLEERTPALTSREEMVALLVDKVLAMVQTDTRNSLRPVINAGGIVLHTGLGRAPLPQSVKENINHVLQGYCNLEYDLESGKRGERNTHIRRLLCEITGAEEALLVNNNAAAVFLALNTLASGKEAIISRGQLVEIGGSFRLPEVMHKSGVIMREVGTTNKTHLRDYEEAITSHTGVIVVAHTSNYRVLGFTEEVELKALCQLAHAHNLPLLHDLGAGVLVDFRQFGLPHEPLVQDSLAAGADVVTFSGDKVIGGLQSGLIVGKRAFLREIHKNPIMRAVRCDKLVYAAMEATLQLFLRHDLLEEHATLRLLTSSVQVIRQRAERLLQQLSPQTIEALHIRIQDCQSQFGSGALPLETLPSVALVLKSSSLSADDLSRHLRTGEPPIIGYIQDDEVYLDMRTVFEEEVEGMAGRLEGVGGEKVIR